MDENWLRIQFVDFNYLLNYVIITVACLLHSAQDKRGYKDNLGTIFLSSP